VAPADALSWGGAARLLGALAVAGLALAYAYGLNAVTDRGGDASPGKNPLAGHRGVAASVYGVVAAAGAGCLALALALGVGAPAAATVVAATLYSAGPRLKAIPVVGTLTNLLIFGPLLLLGAEQPRLDGRTGLLVLAFAALLVQNQVLHEVADRDEDSATGDRTTVIAFGLRPALALSAALSLACAAAIVALPGVALGARLCCAGVVVVGGAASWVLGPRHPRDGRGMHRLYAIGGGAAVYLAALLGT
jgi:4-hydroxybenzoate polyprenyltransferase